MMSIVISIIAQVMMGIGLLFIAIGVGALYRFHHFKSRILAGSNTDVLGFMFICSGVILERGFDMFSLKVGLIALVSMLINPIITHALAKGHAEST